MKLLSMIIFGIVLSFANLSFAYTIGGAYASLVNCSWGQWGYQYGNIGTYEVNGQYYQIFFGTNWCQY